MSTFPSIRFPEQINGDHFLANDQARKPGVHFDFLIFLSATLAFLASWTAARMIVATKSWHGRLSMDTDTGVQKFHDVPTPRVGGMALMTGLVLSLLFIGGETFLLMALLLACSIFAFVAGLIEDVSKNVRPRYRLLAAIASGLAFVLFFQEYCILWRLLWCRRAVLRGSVG